jgi:multicomponent Na+:H+ antiporter subunit E
MELIRGRITLFLLLLATWILLVQPLDLQELIVGGGTALLIAILPGGSGKLYGEVRFLPRRIFTAMLFFFVFLGELIKSNLDVAFRVLHPRLPINPGIVKVKTRLTSRLGRIALANSITLTPGTITVETKGDTFYIHWIDARAKNIEESTRAIVEKFEGYLEVIFG